DPLVTGVQTCALPIYRLVHTKPLPVNAVVPSDAAVRAPVLTTAPVVGRRPGAQPSRDAPPQPVAVPPATQPQAGGRVEGRFDGRSEERRVGKAGGVGG